MTNAVVLHQVELGYRMRHAVAAQLPARPLRDYAGDVAQGSYEAAHFRDTIQDWIDPYNSSLYGKTIYLRR